MTSRYKSFNHRAKHHQRGAVLVVGLIILLILSLLGVQAMRSNVLQERMAGNMRERNLAFQAAEAALRLGEASGAFNAPPSPNIAGNLADWDGSGSSGVVPNFDDAVSADPQFHIAQPLIIRSSSVGRLSGAADPPRELYPVTARGVGRQATSVVILQSTFEPIQ